MGASTPNVTRSLPTLGKIGWHYFYSNTYCTLISGGFLTADTLGMKFFVPERELHRRSLPGPRWSGKNRAHDLVQSRFDDRVAVSLLVEIFVSISHALVTRHVILGQPLPGAVRWPSNTWRSQTSPGPVGRRRVRGGSGDRPLWITAALRPPTLMRPLRPSPFAPLRSTPAPRGRRADPHCPLWGRASAADSNVRADPVRARSGDGLKKSP